MREIATWIDIGAPPARVWEVLTDLEHYRDWNPFIREASGEVAVGARLRLRMHPEHRRPMTFRPRVRAVVPQRELRRLGRLLAPGLFDGEHRFVLTDLEGGGTRLVQSERFTGLLVPLLKRRIADTAGDFEAFNRALRKRAEGRGG
ncbi:SRPBCC domain-containing protein [Streptomyces sp. AV19]|uniref:SRPBCC domain-containing protein n=1 Tax=Streptomyces sp. AV19 TaxID=2793068 RepID=UPI0018FE6374|nr:SRPBCC domain-containing protein [Streptomyces sp. AV19]MBH1934398.1 SRPBCC domain-containing protein [Streptomyces sp. AV19]MDG4536250.1 SRPBCC domain-containing protein [Streptomyces sp. AV19]